MDFDTVLKEELKHIQKTPGKGSATKDNLVSLSLSGGGIRSGAFGLGVIHGLVASNKLSKIDYLSTVSGGGFIGTALTWALHKNKDRGESLVTKEGFPLGTPGHGSANSGVNNELNYIRQQANYLCPGKGINLVSAMGIVLRGTILGIAVYFPLLILLLFITRPWQLAHEYIATAAGIGVLLVGFSILFSLMTYFAYRFFFNRNHPTLATAAYQLRNACQKIFGKLMVVLALFFLLWSLKPVSDFLHDHSIHILVASLSTVFGYFGFIGQFLRNRKTKIPSGVDNLIALVAGALLIYGLLLFSYMIAHSYPPILWGSLAVSFLIGLFTNINMVGFHQMYQDRLMETFLPDSKSIDTQEWNIAKEASQALIQDMCDQQTAGPYHICCGTVILKNSQNHKVKSRLGDSFIMSPRYCGSASTGWQTSETFMKGRFHLATAMAISSAAVNPSDGLSGSGITTNPLVSFLMTLLNIRLGYWAPNPNHKIASKLNWTPDFFIPGFQDLLGFGYQEKSAFLELTDGGHFENLALYEMIRRQVKIAIVSDAESGSLSPSVGFANAIEKVRVDFGANILFDNPETDLKWLVSGSGNQGPFESQFGTAKQGFAMGTIYYSDGSQGKILYIKPTLIDGLPIDIYGYQTAHNAYPNESTADQFFTEQQFEAYRELGYQISSKLFSQLDDNWDLLQK